MCGTPTASRHLRRQHRRWNDGQVIILVALMLPLLIGMTGLVVDAGRAEVGTVQLQSATDAAALAASNAVYEGYSTCLATNPSPCTDTTDPASRSTASKAADVAAGQNGFPTTVTMKYTANADGTVDAQASLSLVQNTYMLRALGTRTLSFTASGTAESTPSGAFVSGGGSQVTSPTPTPTPTSSTSPTPTPTPAPTTALSGGCGVCVINSGSVAATFSAKGSGVATFNGANVMVDSTSNTGLYNGGTGSVTAPGGQFGVTGGYTGAFSPAPTVGATQISDPWATLPPPTTLANNRWVNTFQGSVNAKSNQTVSPGVYTQLTNSGSGSLTLKSGIYIITGPFSGVAASQTCKTCGGGNNASGSSGGTSGGGTSVANTIKANGVLLYFACPKSTAPYFQDCTSTTSTQGGYIDLQSNTTFTITPYTSAPYAGMSVFYDRAENVYASFSGTSSSSVTGSIYLAGGAVSFTGNSGTFVVGTSSQPAAMVVNEFAVGGSATVAITAASVATAPSGSPSPSPSPTPTPTAAPSPTPTPTPTVTPTPAAVTAPKLVA